jgi:hypothetical protein
MDLESARGALAGLAARLCNDLVFRYRRWELVLVGCPLVGAADPIGMLCKMFNLEKPPAPLLICLDEISKLLDHPENKWSKDIPQQKEFWRGLYSLTSAGKNWIRVVMTGFTDAPRNGLAVSDVPLRSLALSMITNAEQEVLAAELLWVYASNNIRFPAFLWALVKSTPGLLGVWAQQIGLGTPEPYPGEAMDLHRNLTAAGEMVPWVKFLTENAVRNWPIVCKFLEEDEPLQLPSEEVRREARNAELATMLNKTVTLSPFAVAVTVLALEKAPEHGTTMYRFLLAALRACTRYSAGCALNVVPSWPEQVQNIVKRAKSDSPLLSADPRLADNAQSLNFPRVDVMPGATVENIGVPFEDFILHALALRLECARIQRAKIVCASDLLPPLVGVLKRPPGRQRHASELNILVSLTSHDPDADLARLCTQTAALLLPSSIKNIMHKEQIEVVKSAQYFEDCHMNFGNLRFEYDEVLIADELVPCTFPVVVVNQPTELKMHADLIDELASPYFTPADFCSRVASAKLKNIQRAEEDLYQVVELVDEAIYNQRVILFKPSDLCNPLCDVVAILPCKNDPETPLGRHKVCFLFIELKDTTSAAVKKKFDLAWKRELMLKPVAEVLNDRRIDVSNVFVCCSRIPIVLKQSKN